MEVMAWFVQHPARILMLAAILAAGWAVLRFGAMGRRADALLWPMGFCVLFAAWEWYVLQSTPDANIRVDLLLIWPIFLALLIWAAWRLIRS